MEKNTKKIKVCIIINDFLVGGAQKLIADMLTVSNGDIEYSLITLFDFPGKSNFYNLVPSEIPVYKMSWKGIRDISLWISLAKIIAKIKPDVVVSHLFFANTVSRILKPFFAFRIITVEHNTYIGKTFLQKLCDFLLSFYTFKIVGVSKTVADFTSKQEHIPRKQFEVIYNGIQVNAVKMAVTGVNREQFLSDLGIDQKSKVFLSVGRLTTQKNQMLLINAFAEFCKKNSQFILILLGEGALRENLEAQISALNLSKKVFLLGARSDVYKFYAIADFLVSTSVIEGLSIAYLEALSAGVPLIATRTAGTDEIIEDTQNGFFIEEATVSSVLESFNKALEVDYGNLSKNAEKTGSRFDISHTVQKYESLYRNSVQGN